MKEVAHRDKKREGDRQEAEKKRQLEKDAKMGTLRNQAAATPALADEGMEEWDVNTERVSDGITANSFQSEAGERRPLGTRPTPCDKWRPSWKGKKKE